jgi:large repetitive protein
VNYLRTLSTAKKAALLVALLGVLGVAAGLAVAKSGPPAPTITSEPANPTAATSASFSFTDSQAKVTFVCALDGSAYTACTSPKSYTGLAAGTHKFSVEAKDTSGATSDATSYSWTVDVTPPAITVSFPAAGAGPISAAKWNDGCGRSPGVCGSATDPSGVAVVLVSIKQNGSGNYWNGSSYSSSSEAWQFAAVSSTSAGANWFYALPRPTPDGQYTLHVAAMDWLGNATSFASPASSTFTIDTAPPPAPKIDSKPATPTNQTTASFGFSDSESGVSFLCRLDSGSFGTCSSPKSYTSLKEGTHTFYVEAVDVAGNISSATSYSWTVDTTAPAQPTITGHPASSTTATDATFTFSDKESGVGLQCQLDTQSWQSCTSPKTYNGLAAGSHTFHVRAVDAAGNTSSAATFTWTIQQSSGMPFSISGDVPNPLYPGAAAQAIALKVTNPNNVTIFVTALSASVQSTGATGCNTTWFQTAAASIPSAGISVPANGSVTIPTANDPTLQMVESGTNQDACVGAHLTLSYTGSAHS